MTLKQSLLLFVLLGSLTCAMSCSGSKAYDGTVTASVQLRYASDPAAFPSIPDGQIRNTVRVFCYNDDGTLSTGSPVAEKTVYGKDPEISFSLPVGKYRVSVWSDCAPDDGSPRWDVSDFRSIPMTGEHSGCDEYVLAYRGNAELDASAPIVVLPVNMIMPMARWEVVATDAAEFGDTDISLYRFRFTYTQFYPTAFGMFFDEPTDAVSGLSFYSKAKVLESGNVLLGFDYVLLSRAFSHVPVILEVMAADGTILHTAAVNLYLSRPQRISLQGDYLSGHTASGIEMDPEFDGNIDINI